MIVRSRGASATLSSPDSGGTPAIRPPRRVAHVVAVALVAMAAVVLFWQAKSFGFLGFDSWPLIATSRVGSLHELFGLLGRSLMQGYYPVAYWRPLLQWTIAADYALWGLTPTGYHLTSILVFAGCALALYAFSVRLGSGESRFAPWIALAVFVLHPALYDVVPIPPRRSEMLC